MPDKIALLTEGSADTLLSASRGNQLIGAVNALLGLTGVNGIDIVKSDSNVIIDGARARGGTTAAPASSSEIQQVLITAIGPLFLTCVPQPQTDPATAEFLVARPMYLCGSDAFSGFPITGVNSGPPLVIDGVTWGELNSATNYNSRTVSHPTLGTYLSYLQPRYHIGDIIYIGTSNKTVRVNQGQIVTLIDLNLNGRHWSGPELDGEWREVSNCENGVTTTFEVWSRPVQ